MFCFVLKKANFVLFERSVVVWIKCVLYLKRTMTLPDVIKRSFYGPWTKWEQHTQGERVLCESFFAIDLLLNKITHFRDVVENSAICLIPVTLLFIGVYFSLMRSIYCFSDHLSWNTSSLKSQWSCSLKGFTSSIHLSIFFIGALFLIVYKGL